jgi:excisionase family DNA binding protein
MQKTKEKNTLASEKPAIILPAEVWQDIQNRLEHLENELARPAPEEDRFFDIKELATYTKKAISSLYVLVHFNKMPYLKAGGKLLFSKKSIDKWLNQGCPNIGKEAIEAEASNYLVNGKFSKNSKTAKK